MKSSARRRRKAIRLVLFWRCALLLTETPLANPEPNVAAENGED
jgi:hypothetical protein